MRPSEASVAWENGQRPVRVDLDAEWLPDNEVTAILSWADLRKLGITDRTVAVLEAV